MDEFVKRLKELNRFATPGRKQHCQQANLPPPQLTGSGPPTKEGPMALATYVAENGLVGHYWEERPLGLSVFDAPV
jgi:hypothetical protein